MAKNEWDLKSWEEAEEMASKLTEENPKDTYLPVDRGPYVSPRFGTVKLPKVGDEVSYTFNGDYYPDGAINSVSKTGFKIVTTTGNVYRRRKKTAAWIKEGGTWSLIHGHIKRLSREF